MDIFMKHLDSELFVYLLYNRKGCHLKNALICKVLL